MFGNGVASLQIFSFYHCCGCLSSITNNQLHMNSKIKYICIKKRRDDSLEGRRIFNRGSLSIANVIEERASLAIVLEMC